jgi:hypothetical protein
MRSKTQERIEGLARERAATTIDLGMVEEGIEVGKRIMAETIAAYSSNPAVAATVRDASATTPVAAQDMPAGGDYLNEVRATSASPRES